ncbi:MAG: hypothetical protein A2469_00275 [Candidatus Magasanikbacteria bacterium RIFOXYC2_FULL_40_16]|uniref:Bifunctional protein FolD n=2 Tax=Candidatus Magasanikiibacteriota TaxID=1752731 RepID=A0A1F6NHJ1_9BACT|nr:MAG: hypothetical protein A2224_02505 [Candidatus Magasanikbacteria bacterium RIFOXYA2_FULL_40_20]OGH83349.1 MAG: hypothetical protein A2373_00020 [Candidatus Magasanikbacteria bacterium RIFOXYB1_FULL_40_15]OGH90423.1 MAG: hypothetical protein A2469_00275 [Candidatus Magasanikbacteria bacterium RIFOXYC2_FULL_40_16]
MSKLINGKLIAEKIEKGLAKKTAKLKKQGITPKLVVVLVGNDKPSLKYVEKKRLLAKKIGVDFELKKFKKNITTAELKAEIQKIQKDKSRTFQQATKTELKNFSNALSSPRQTMRYSKKVRDKSISGMIVQLPLPETIDKKIILDAVNPNIDVDCLNSSNQNKLAQGKAVFLPPTPAAIMEILKYLKVKLKNKKIAVIGKGILVGKPVAEILNKKGCQIKICDSKTPDIKEICLDSDIIIVGVGKKHLITKDMVHKKSIVIDAGTVVINKKMYGGVDYKNVSKIAKYTTPVPGGVGPITVACLLKNTIENAQ